MPLAGIANNWLPGQRQATCVAITGVLTSWSKYQLSTVVNCHTVPMTQYLYDTGLALRVALHSV